MSDQTLLHVCETLYFPLSIRIGEATKRQYRIALRHFADFLGRPATPADLQDDVLTCWMSRRLAEGLAPVTVREQAGRLQTLWTWMARRRIVEHFPTFAKPRIPESMPLAFSEDELRRFFHSCRKERGRIAGIPADLWATSFFAFVFCTSERKSAALAVQISWVDLENRVCTIPASVRKGGIKHAIYPLWDELVPLIRDCIAADPRRVHVWPWDKCGESYYTMLHRILRDAGLPSDRKHQTHALRVSHNTHHKRLTGQHSPLLGHSDSATSERHYEDRRYTQKDAHRLFIPW